MQEKLDLKSMSFAQVRALCDSLGFPAFRAGQIFAWCRARHYRIFRDDRPEQSRPRRITGKNLSYAL